MDYLLIWLAKLAFPKYWAIPTKIVYNQSRLEVGRGKDKSFAYEEQNNMFGMMHPSVRKTTSRGRGVGHETGNLAVYSSRFSSAYDYFLRQKHFGIPHRDYIEATVNSGYASDKNYLEKWQDINADTASKTFVIWFILGLIIYGISVGVKRIR